jgi:hypothetical protein
VAPQLGGGRRNNYSTKTRQAGRANEQSMYSLMSMILTHNDQGQSYKTFYGHNLQNFVIS